ncbi:MAG: ArsC/Spx/MgsR family protein [Bacteroidia bacterium]
MLKIYFKPNCSTCRNALNLIKENTDEDYELTEYLVEVPSQKEIKEILKMLGLKAEDLVRKKEHLYKEKYEGKKLTNAQWIKILHENPILIERPIVVKDGKAIIGRPIEKILDILS